MYTSGVRTPFLISFLIDMYEEKCLRGDPDVDIAELSTKVLTYCSLMAIEVDQIRKTYWNYVAANFKIQMTLNMHNSKKSAETSEEKLCSPV